MDDATAVMAGHTKKYNIPLSHFEYKYIQNCTDGKELERIYKELISGEFGSFKELENLTLERIRNVKPNSQILRQDKAPLDKSALPDDERQQLDDFLNQMKDTKRTITNDHPNNGIDSLPIRSKSIISNSITPTPSAPVITSNNGRPKRIVPRSYDEWGKLDQKLSRESNSDTDDEEEEDEDDENEKKNLFTNKSRLSNQISDKSQRLKMAEQHRLNGNIAFKANNYQQSIDSYTNSIMLDKTNPVVYMNRAIAYYKLNNYDASITDCSHILSNDPRHIKALYRRASCRIAKQEYDEAKHDLDTLLAIDGENNEAKNLLKTIPTVPKTKGVRIPITEDDGEEEEVHTQPLTSVPVKIPILEVEEEEEEQEEEDEPMTNGSIQSTNINIPQKSNIHARPCIDSQEASPAMFDSHFHQRDDLNQFQHNMDSHLSSLNTRVDHHDDDDDDDEMALGDEASAGLLGNMSDDDVNVSHSLNVSPTMDDGEDDSVPELIEQKPLGTPPLTSTTNGNPINQHTTYRINQNYTQNDISSITNDDSYHHNTIPTISNNYSSISSNSFEQRSSTTTTNLSNDQISNSNFSSTIQNWLRDLVASQSTRRSSSFPEKPWSKSMRPYALDRLQRDIERFYRLNEYKNTIDASKKMLKNGVLDYHKHAEHIVSTLTMCAQSYFKTNDYTRTVQYASEALQYNKMDTTALICRAKAFENDKFLLYSYADYARIPSYDFNYSSAQRACEKLIDELIAVEGQTWREKLPKDNNDDERYLTYIKIKDKFSETDPYLWYRNRGNQLYLDACFVLAIRCFTHCIELKSDVAFPYTNRAACYLKVFEPQKTLNDCDKALKLDPINVRALYRKACAYKMLSNDSLYRLTLKNLLEIQPNNQIILSEYFSSQHEQIPRKMRRLRANNSTDTTSITPSSSSMEIKNSQSIESNNLSYEELEEIRMKKNLPFSFNTKFQFTQQLTLLKSDDIKGACSLILRLPIKGLLKIISGVSPKLIETIVLACRTMIYAEARYKQTHELSASSSSFSYITFSFNILIELTTLPRLDSALSMIDQQCRASLDDLLAYSSSVSTIINDLGKLERLRKPNNS
jgi:tetratricopeptide (TPR) repeat protein